MKKITLLFFVSLLALSFSKAQTTLVLDSSFSNDGIVTWGPGDRINSIIEQPDGKILALGSTHLIRYTNNGIQDSTFGINGILNIGPYGATSMALGPSGEIVISFTKQGNDYAEIRKFLSNGSPDSSFGNNGSIYKNSYPSQYFDHLEILPNSEILTLFTYSDTSNNNTDKNVIYRFNLDGTMDANDSAFTNKIDIQFEDIIHMELAPNGHLMVFGTREIWSFWSPLIIANFLANINTNSGDILEYGPGAGYPLDWHLVSLACSVDGSARLVLRKRLPLYPDYDYYCRGLDSYLNINPLFYSIYPYDPYTGIQPRIGVVAFSDKITLGIGNIHDLGSGLKILHLDEYARIDSICFKPTAMYPEGAIVVTQNKKILVGGGSSHFVLARYLKPCSSIGIEEPNQNVKPVIYPNPSSGKFTVDFGDNPIEGELEIYSLSGQLVYSQIIEGETQLELHLSLDMGMYLIRILSEDKYTTERIIIQ